MLKDNFEKLPGILKMLEKLPGILKMLEELPGILKMSQKFWRCLKNLQRFCRAAQLGYIEIYLKLYASCSFYPKSCNCMPNRSVLHWCFVLSSLEMLDQKPTVSLYQKVTLRLSSLVSQFLQDFDSLRCCLMVETWSSWKLENWPKTLFHLAVGWPRQY